MPSLSIEFHVCNSVYISNYKELIFKPKRLGIKPISGSSLLYQLFCRPTFLDWFHNIQFFSLTFTFLLLTTDQ